MSDEKYSIIHIASSIHESYLAVMSEEDKKELMFDRMAYGRMQYEVFFDEHGIVVEVKHIPVVTN